MHLSVVSLGQGPIGFPVLKIASSGTAFQAVAPCLFGL